MKIRRGLALEMILLLGVLTLGLYAQSSQSETHSDSDHEVSGTIQEVSPTVRLIRISSADQPDVTICIELDTKITVRGKESTLNDLKTGQYVEVLLQRESSKAISINAT